MTTSSHPAQKKQLLPKAPQQGISESSWGGPLTSSLLHRRTLRHREGRDAKITAGPPRASLGPSYKFFDTAEDTEGQRAQWLPKVTQHGLRMPSLGTRY